MPKVATKPVTPRVVCARIVRLLESLPVHDRARTLRAAEAMLALDDDAADHEEAT